MSSKYYWLKLKKDFFKRHDIRLVEEMPNGKEYILFYLKLLCESVDHDGNLRFSDEIPYNDEMLATITNSTVSVVRGAVEIFTKLGMMDLLDDGTLYMRGVEKMIGHETEWARKKREYRQHQTAVETEVIEDNVLPLSDKSKSKSKSKSKNINNTGRFTPPSMEEVESYCKERGNNVNAQTFIDFYQSKGWMVGKNKMKDWKAAVRTWEKSDKGHVRIAVPTYINEQEQGKYDGEGKLPWD